MKPKLFISRKIFSVGSILAASLVLSQITPTVPSSSENYIFVIEPENGNPVADAQSPGNHTVQYFDGLGRPKQTVMSKATTTGADMLIHYEYDGFGRQAKDYLPVGAAQSNGAYVNDPISRYNAFYPGQYGTNIYYSEKEIENSPLNRVMKQAAPGDDWKLGSGHEIKFEYLTNKISDQVLIFYIDAGLNLVKGKNIDQYPELEYYYLDGYLYKTVTTDENGSKIEEYKNKQGQVILKRSFSTTGSGSGLDHYDTYYAYDIYGNLTYVIPPLLADLYAGGTTIPSDWGTKMSDLGYTYYYDKRNRLVEKKLPGKGWEYMVYDKQDRLIATQDALQKLTNTWLFTKYDKFGRVVITGTVVKSKSRPDLQTEADGWEDNNTLGNSSYTDSGITIYYQLTSGFPGNAAHQTLSINYYDNYFGQAQAGFTVPGLDEKIEDQHTRNGSASASESLKGLLTSTTIRVLGTSDWEHIYTVYDIKSRPVRTHKIFHPQVGAKGSTIVTNKLNFRGSPTLVRTSHQKPGTLSIVVTVDNFTYDMQGRLTRHTHKTGTNPEQLLAANSYDQLGQLMNKKTGGTNLTGGTGRLQQVDYKYNVRGWLTKINDPDVDLLGQSGIPNGSNDDLFAFKIQYQNLTHGGQAAAVPLYNGNISQTFWKSSQNNVIRGYSYEYDQINRLRHAHFNLPLSGGTAHYSGSFDEEMTYDKHGNILSMKRNLEDANNGTAIDMDNLTYGYTNNTNKLIKVEDSTNNTAGFNNGANSTIEYTYDVNGNMKSDLNKGITNITYNHLNLPVQITFSGTTTKKIDYLYNASGQKVQKKVTNGSTIQTTDYLDGYQYYNGVLQFFPTSEGYVKNTVVSGQNTYDYVFNYTDHLGNVRVSYMRDPNNGQIKILEENHYYPFGLKHSRYAPLIGKMDALADDSGKAIIGVDPNNDTAKASLYKYKYNGKELQDELGLNLYDYGARNYDAALGRFFSMDKYSDAYYHITPYQYTANNPVRLIDVNGEFIWIYENGNKYKYDNGQLYSKNKESGEYDQEYNAEEGSYIAQMQGYLNQIGCDDCKDGKALLDFFGNDQRDITIRENKSKDPRYKGKNAYNSAGTTVLTFFNQKDQIPVDGGFERVNQNFFLTLGHELGHAQSSFLYGSVRNEEWYTQDDKIVVKDEVYAIYIENKLRKENNFPLRTHYSTEKPFKVNESSKVLEKVKGNWIMTPSARVILNTIQAPSNRKK